MVALIAFLLISLAFIPSASGVVRRTEKLGVSYNDAQGNPPSCQFQIEGTWTKVSDYLYEKVVNMNGYNEIEIWWQAYIYAPGWIDFVDLEMRVYRSENGQFVRQTPLQGDDYWKFTGDWSGAIGAIYGNTNGFDWTYKVTWFSTSQDFYWCTYPPNVNYDDETTWLTFYIW
jgi:hypothetical protein